MASKETKSQASPSDQADVATSSDEQTRRASVSKSMVSEDSQTVLLDHPSPTDSSPKPSSDIPNLHQSQAPDTPSKPVMRRSDTSLEPKKCWICLQEETDDTPTSSRWRSPCKCRLQAHESCLLDWVSEVERPGSQGGQGKSKVECPQCKTPIRIIRPRSYFLDAWRRLQRLQLRLILPFCGLVLVGGVVAGAYFHGLGSVYLVFGKEDAQRFLEIDEAAPWWRDIRLALPLVPVSLLASRTSYTDVVLPFLPLWFLFAKPPLTNAPLWPPSVPMTLLILPYLRKGYTAAYQFLFAKREKAWLKELQPRASEHGENDEHGQNAPADDDGEMNIEFGINLEVVEEEIVDEPPQDQDQAPAPLPQQGQAEGQQDRPLAEQLAPPAGQDNQQENQNGNGNGNLANAANVLPVILNVVLERTVSALVFPGVARGMGLALEFALPKKWKTTTNEAASTHVLHSIFGRSIAGGFLFVLLKDTLGLYSKYRMAQVHRQRSIANYDPKEIRKDNKSRSKS